MLDALGIELGRERELYANDLEYAAALLGTEPETIGDILSGESSLGGVRELSWATTATAPAAQRQAAAQSASQVRHLLIVWAPLAAGALLVALLVALSRAWAR